mmetsp:Transcript_29389/g.70939  ORF Transcript_29389/g.70939 Transcript_29389/m.70939 type:complete len:515 (-) Transcript_29389:223-1767(-)
MIKTNNDDNINNTSSPSSPPPTRTSISPLPYVTPPAAHRPSFYQRLQSSSFLFPKTLSSPRMMTMIDNSSSGVDGGNSSCGDGSKNTSGNNEVGDESAARPEGRTPDINHSGGSIEKESTISSYGNDLYRLSACNKEARGKTFIRNDGLDSLTSDNNNLPADNKKLVRFRFQDKSSVVLHPLHGVPLASEMTPREKARTWYTPSELDRFKYDAAKHAAVKIVRYDTEKAGHHFAMMGDFDNRAGAAAPVAQTTKTTSSEKRYYNENEYNDNCFNSGEIICKRGLGYHFSRCRKHARIVTRSAVMAWQAALNDPSSDIAKVEKDLPSVAGARSSRSVSRGSGGNGNRDAGASRSACVNAKEFSKVKQEKEQMMLALISSKCSRVAREEARWRGDVDYRVAYPERHHDAVARKGWNAPTTRGRASDRDSGKNLDKKKRALAVADDHCERRCTTGSRAPSPLRSASQSLAGSSSNKRQRRNAVTGAGGGCDDGSRTNEALASPVTFDYPSGMQHAEV